MASNLLKEFLVGIGFKIDETGMAKAIGSANKVETAITATEQRETDKRTAIQKKASTAHEKGETEAAKRARERNVQALKQVEVMAVQASAFVMKVGAAVTAASAGIFYAVAEAAKSLDQLNYTSARAGSSVQGMSAFAYAASQLGASVDEANSSLGEFGKKIVIYPGLARELERVGVKVKDVNGHMRDSAAIATDYGAFLARVKNNDPVNGYANALARGQTFGFGRPMVDALMNPGFVDREAQYRKDHPADNAAGRDATSFEQSMRHLGEVVDGVKTKVVDNLFVRLQPMLDKLADWTAAHGDKIADVFGRIADDLIKLGNAIANQLAKVDWDAMLGGVEKVSAAFGKWADGLTGDNGAIAVFGLLGVALTEKILGPLKLITGALGALASMSLPGWFAAIVGAGGIAGAMNAPHVDDFGRDAGTWGGDGPDTGGLGAHTRHRKSHNPQGVFERLWNAGKKAVGLGGDAPGGPVPNGFQERGLAAMRYLVDKKGWTPAAAAIAVGNAQQESGIKSDGAAGDPNTPGGSHYMFQWNNGKNNDTVNGRRAQYERFAAARGKSPTDFYTSLDFMDEERKGMPRLRDWDKQTDLSRAGDISHAYEGYGDDSTGTRVQNARNWLSTYMNQPKAAAVPPLAPAPAAGQPVASSYTGRDGIMSDANLARYNADRAAWLASHPATAKLAGMAPILSGDQPGMKKGDSPLSKAVQDFYAKGGGTMGAGAWKMAPEGFKLGRPLGDPSIHSSSITNSRGDVILNHSPTYNVNGGDARQNIETAQLSASRGSQDLLRHMQGAVA